MCRYREAAESVNVAARLPLDVDDDDDVDSVVSASTASQVSRLGLKQNTTLGKVGFWIRKAFFFYVLKERNVRL